MRIVADSNILAVKSCFEDLGELRLVSGRTLSRQDLLQADALLVRSVTRVDAELLKGTPIQFVGTATSGTDHIDLDYLQSRSIAFADARGSNANAVVDYCFAALACAVLHRNLRLERCTVGIIGAGHVGGLFAQKLQALGIKVRICDPPLQRLLAAQSTPESTVAVPAPSRLPLSHFRTLPELLQCDVISLHVPLTVDGEFPTNRLLGERELAQLRPGTMLINTCRGSVVHEPALLRKLSANEGITCVVDVWENEPNISSALVGKVDFATPHIAGYSLDAKLNATRMLLQALCLHFQLPVAGEMSGELTATSLPHLAVVDQARSPWRLLLDMFPLPQLSDMLKNSARQEHVEIQFDAMRKRLLERREFNRYQVPATGLSAEQLALLRAMGVLPG